MPREKFWEKKKYMSVSNAKSSCLENVVTLGCRETDNRGYR